MCSTSALPEHFMNEIWKDDIGGNIVLIRLPTFLLAFRDAWMHEKNLIVVCGLKQMILMLYRDYA